MQFAAGASAAGSGGSVSMRSGAGTDGGALSLVAGAGRSGAGGDLTLLAGASNASKSSGGTVAIAGGNASQSGSTAGGLALQAGASIGENGNGGPITLSGGLAAKGLGGNVEIQPGRGASGNGAVVVRGADGAALIEAIDSSVAIAASQHVSVRAGASAAINVSSAGLLGNGSVGSKADVFAETTVHSHLQVMESVRLGDIASRLLRTRSASKVSSFAVKDQSYPATSVFAASVTVAANNGNASLAMAEFMYTKAGKVVRISNFQKTEIGIKLSVRVDDAGDGLQCDASEPVYFSVVQLLLL